MALYLGKATCNGIAIGRIRYYFKQENNISRSTIEDVEAEIHRFEMAKEKAIRELTALYEKAVREVGKNNAEIFNFHIMALDDKDILDSIFSIIRSQKVNAEYAVATTCDRFSELIANMEDEYFSARSADIKDVSERLVRILIGLDEQSALTDEPVILMAEDLAPSETVKMDKEKLLSIVTRLGSVNSHASILIRTMNIPSVIGVDIDASWDGKLGIVDGYEGKVYIDPEISILEKYRKKQEEYETKKKLLLELKGRENITRSGKKVELLANIGNLGDLESVIQNDAGGIGLFRSEFLYLENSDFPSEEEQFRAYKKVVETMGDKKVIIRTLDTGADKPAAYFGLEREENPALGYRAIRICLTQQEIFRTQLRALFRASAYGNLSIIYPMIISVDEVLKIKEISQSVRDELVGEGIKIGTVKEGIMIETPAAALITDELAKYVDFFSIGTNDLSQYTLAIDRQNAKLDSFFNAHHPAILRLIKLVCENAHKAGIRVGICGELGADTDLTQDFIEMGVDELSVSPGTVLKVRQAIRECR